MTSFYWTKLALNSAITEHGYRM